VPCPPICASCSPNVHINLTPSAVNYYWWGNVIDIVLCFYFHYLAGKNGHQLPMCICGIVCMLYTAALCYCVLSCCFLKYSHLFVNRMSVDLLTGDSNSRPAHALTEFTQQSIPVAFLSGEQRGVLKNKNNKNAVILACAGTSICYCYHSWNVSGFFILLDHFFPSC